MKGSSTKSHNLKKIISKKIDKSKWSITLWKGKENKEHLSQSLLLSLFRLIRNTRKKRISRNITIPLDKKKGKFICSKEKSQISRKKLKSLNWPIKPKSKIWRQNKINTFTRSSSWSWKLQKVKWKLHKKNICTISLKRSWKL